jgi:hypothetical protein
LTEITLEKLLAMAGDHARQVLIEHKARQLAPAFLYLSEGGEATIRICPWSNDTEKQLAQAALRVSMRDANVKMYSGVMEAWFSHSPPGMPIEEAKKIRASKDPNRREAVIAFATDGVKQVWQEWEIKRDWKGQIRDLAPMPIGKEDQFMSPFVNLLGGTA